MSCVWRLLPHIRRHFHQFIAQKEHAQHSVGRQGKCHVSGVQAHCTYRAVVHAGLEFHHDAVLVNCVLAQVDVVGSGAVGMISRRGVACKQRGPAISTSFLALRLADFLDDP